jgi:hypothetical protein
MDGKRVGLMDVEKTMEFILEQLAHVAALQAAALERQAAAEQRQAAAEERQAAAEERQATAEERQAAAEERQAAAEERQAAAEQRQARSDRRLDRAIRLAVWEARQERKKRREADEKLDEYITKLAAAQLITEEKLQRFIDERRGANGKG